jgi:hypothetical protein
MIRHLTCIWGRRSVRMLNGGTDRNLPQPFVAGLGVGSHFVHADVETGLQTNPRPPSFVYY